LSEIIRLVKNRRLFTFCIDLEGSRRLSSSRLLLSLLAAKSPRHSSAITSGLADTLHELLQAESLIQDSSNSGHSCRLWFEEKVWSATVEIHPQSLLMIFSQILEGPFMSSEIAGPLLTVALTLLEKKSHPRRSTGQSQWANLSSNSLTISAGSASPPLIFPRSDCNPMNISDSVTSQYFGAWLLFKLFVVCSHMRTQISRSERLYLESTL
jgi:hypothetical protein